MRAAGYQRGRRLLHALLGTVLFFVSSSPAFAIPTLQLYVEGSTYDPADETWALTGGNTFTLWVIGDVGHYGTISGVRLSGAAATTEILTGGHVTVAPTTATGIVDPSVPTAPGSPTTSADGQRPTLGDGSYMPWHGEFGPGTSFFEWSLGDFTKTDSPVGDFTGQYPTSFASTGQINAYTITLSGLTSVHFDAYDHILSTNGVNATKKNSLSAPTYKYVSTPGSHDAEMQLTAVPEPDTLVLLGGALVALVVLTRRHA